MTKWCCFNKDNPRFSAFRALSSMVVCWWLWKEPLYWWWDEDADSRLRDGESYCGFSEWTLTSTQAVKHLVQLVNSPTPYWCVLMPALSRPEHVSGASAERSETKSNGAERNGRDSKRWSGRSRRGNGAESKIIEMGLSVERIFSPLTLHSHALFQTLCRATSNSSVVLGFGWSLW